MFDRITCAAAAFWIEMPAPPFAAMTLPWKVLTPTGTPEVPSAAGPVRLPAMALPDAPVPLRITPASEGFEGLVPLLPEITLPRTTLFEDSIWSPLMWFATSARPSEPSPMKLPCTVLPSALASIWTPLRPLPEITFRSLDEDPPIVFCGDWISMPKPAFGSGPSPDAVVPMRFPSTEFPPAGEVLGGFVLLRRIPVW